jgi:quinolinate synthase
MFIWPFALLLAFFFQAGDVPPVAGEVFNSAEKAQLENAKNIEQRIKVYTATSRRIQQTLETSVDKEDFRTVPENLTLWIALLSKSLEDIEANLKSKKKSGALIKYEIQLRKSIANTASLKIKAPVDQQDLFDSCISQAETVRRKFVAILFLH